MASEDTDSTMSSWDITTASSPCMSCRGNALSVRVGTVAVRKTTLKGWSRGPALPRLENSTHSCNLLDMRCHRTSFYNMSRQEVGALHRRHWCLNFPVHRWATLPAIKDMFKETYFMAFAIFEVSAPLYGSIIGRNSELFTYRFSYRTDNGHTSSLLPCFFQNGLQEGYRYK